MMSLAKQRYQQKPEVKAKRAKWMREIYYPTHKKLVAKRNLEQYYKNPEKNRSYGFISYYRKKIILLHKNKCDKCGSKINLQLHHKNYTIKKKYMNGSGKSNLRFNLKKVMVLCKKCHCHIHGMIAHV